MVRIGLCVIAAVSSLAPAFAEVKHVVVFGVDGLSPAGVQRARTPNMNFMVREGAFSFDARGVLSTSSSQNWASMLMGAGPEQHGITSNAWERDDYAIEPTTTGLEPIFPTIFTVLRQARPEATLGAVYDWDGFGRLFEHSAVDAAINGDGPKDTVARAVAFMNEAKPDFLFVHIDHVDAALHAHGHGSDAYYRAVELADELLGDVRQGLAEAGMAHEAVVIVTSDHGGVGKGHGGESMAELEIPWLMWGAGVKEGKRITDPVNTYDTAATAAHVLGVTQPYHWIARPVVSALAGEKDQAPAPDMPGYLPMPRVYPEGGIIEELGGPIRMRVDSPKAVIRYTLDGSEPTMASPTYRGPVTLEHPAVVAAKSFNGTRAMSATTRAEFMSRDNGIHYTYHEGRWRRVPDLDDEPIVKRGRVAQFELAGVSPRDDFFAVRYTSHLDIAAEGAYTFYLKADDGANLHVDGEQVVDNDGSGGAREKVGRVDLEAGRHALTVEYFEAFGDTVLRVQYGGPDFEKQAIPPHRLYLEPAE